VYRPRSFHGVSDVWWRRDELHGAMVVMAQTNRQVPSDLSAENPVSVAVMRATEHLWVYEQFDRIL